MPRFVLEIGTEEIPPRYFPVALPQFKADGEAMLARARLSYREVKVYGTPRRLALIAEEMAAVQAPAVREERGPAARVAFDAEGKPTRAAMGFARRHGVSAEKLERKQTDQGEYVFAIIQEPELPAAQALAPLLPGLITSIPFPKTMRWGSGSLRFARPIRWLLALVDDEVVEFELAGLTSGRLTRGHPTLAEGVSEVKSARAYEDALRTRYVIVNQGERRAEIKVWLDLRCEEANALLVDGGLLEETAFLVEWPTAALGQFDPTYLRLPRAVLVEEMQHVQGYFPLSDQQGELLPQFVAVRDGGSEHLAMVVAGWEDVLKAKLIDASYFYGQDLRRPLAERVEDLKGIAFHERLGTMYDKARRLAHVAACLAAQVNLGASERAALDRAALLCKADLTTDMVTEVSNLQGLMGREYALASGEAPEVAEAIGEHYRPRFSGDNIPRTQLGRLLAIADKVDTVTTCFAVGVVPTGSADPYGLRREGSGLVSIIVVASLGLSLAGLLRACLKALGEQIELPRSADQTAHEVTDFLRQRLETHLREDQGIRYDLVEAALAVGVDDLDRAAKRAGALQFLAGPEREHPVPEYEFLPTVIAATRPINISKDSPGGEVDPRLFQDKAESALWEAYQSVLREAERANLVELFQLFGRLRAPIDRYFDEVLVMHEEESIRNNRLAMCWQISQLFRRLADFSLIVQL